MRVYLKRLYCLIRQEESVLSASSSPGIILARLFFSRQTQVECSWVFCGGSYVSYLLQERWKNDETVSGIIHFLLVYLAFPFFFHLKVALFISRTCYFKTLSAIVFCFTGLIYGTYCSVSHVLCEGILISEAAFIPACLMLTIIGNNTANASRGKAENYTDLIIGRWSNIIHTKPKTFSLPQTEATKSWV